MSLLAFLALMLSPAHPNLPSDTPTDPSGLRLGIHTTLAMPALGTGPLASEIAGLRTSLGYESRSGWLTELVLQLTSNWDDSGMFAGGVAVSKTIAPYVRAGGFALLGRSDIKDSERTVLVIGPRLAIHAHLVQIYWEPGVTLRPGADPGTVATLARFGLGIGFFGF